METEAQLISIFRERVVEFSVTSEDGTRQYKSVPDTDLLEQNVKLVMIEVFPLYRPSAIAPRNFLWLNHKGLEKMVTVLGQDHYIIIPWKDITVMCSYSLTFFRKLQTTEF